MCIRDSCKSADGRSACVIRGLEAIVSPYGIPITNEYDCPLLSLSHIIFTTKTSEVLKGVSVIHQCTETCQFIDKECGRNVEREDICLSRLEYQHDFSGKLYVLSECILYDNLVTLGLVTTYLSVCRLWF